MESYPGDYWYVSNGGDTVCGFYMIGLPSQLVELEFMEFDIDCDHGGLLAVVDGWETQMQYFPGEYDSPLPMEERYKTYCGKNTPSKTILASQNVALLQFRIPKAGQGFRLFARFLKNPEPCNVMSLFGEGTYTLRNYGSRSNCSVSFLYPETIQLVEVDVGMTSEVAAPFRETGVVAKCKKRGMSDYLEVRGGQGLDPLLMGLVTDVCGLDSTAGSVTHRVGCSHTVVRLVSGGSYYNSVTFTYRTLSPAEMTPAVFTGCLLN